jgi:hypothetical protein
MDPHYRHTQIGWAVIIPAIGVAALTAALLELGHVTLFVPVVMGALLVALLVLFAWLTVTVDDEAVDLRFGLRGFHQRTPLSEIAAADAVRNSWLAGWGIRVIPGGRLYNVSGLDAVRLRLTDGRVVRVGTDEPEVLLAAVKAALARTRGSR